MPDLMADMADLLTHIDDLLRSGGGGAYSDANRSPIPICGDH